MLLPSSPLSSPHYPVVSMLSQDRPTDDEDRFLTVAFFKGETMKMLQESHRFLFSVNFIHFCYSGMVAVHGIKAADKE